MRILVTGCARSGTMYCVQSLAQFGVRLGHERLGAHGQVSWYALFPKVRPPYGEHVTDFDYVGVFHQVRHPLNVIASTQSLKEESWNFIHVCLGIDPSEPQALRAARYWLLWNDRAASLADRSFRVEQPQAAYREIARIVRPGTEQIGSHELASDINTRLHGPTLNAVDRFSTRLGLRTPRRVRDLFRTASREYRSADDLRAELASLDHPLWKKVERAANLFGYDSV